MADATQASDDLNLVSDATGTGVGDIVFKAGAGPNAVEQARIKRNGTVTGVLASAGGGGGGIPVLNVKSSPFNAVGDGITDDTAAIQAAIAAAAAASPIGTVYIPAGTYKLTAALTIPFAPGLRIMGAGRRSSYLKQFTGNTPVIKSIVDLAHSVYIGYLNLSWNTQPTSADTQSLGIMWGHAAGVDTTRFGWVVEQIRVEFPAIGFGTFRTTNHATVWGTVIRDSEIQGAAIGGIVFDSGAGNPNNKLSNLYITNTGTSVVPTSAAITLVGTECLCDGLDLEGWTNTIIQVSGLSSPVTFLNTHIENSSFVAGSGVITCIDIANGGAIFKSITFGNMSTNIGGGGLVRIFHINQGYLVVDGVNIAFNTPVAGTVKAFGAEDTTSKLFVRGARSTGAVAVPLPLTAGDTTTAATLRESEANFYNRNYGHQVTAIAYSALMATDPELGSIFTIVATNGTAFTISNPASTQLVTGKQITYDIKNTSGGALGAITFGAAFLLAGAFVAPATGKRRTITFYYDGTNWVERNRAAADI